MRFEVLSPVSAERRTQSHGDVCVVADVGPFDTDDVGQLAFIDEVLIPMGVMAPLRDGVTTVASVLALVGDDADAARKVLDEEIARGTKARPTLVKALEKVIADSDDAANEQE